jgi:DNA replication protein DnaC
MSMKPPVDPAVVIQLQPDQVDDPVWLEQQWAHGEERMKRIPRIFRSARPTEGLVQQWVQHLVTKAVELNPNNPKILQGGSLVLSGSVGVGKTYQAYGALRALSMSGCQCRWESGTVANVFANLRPNSPVASEKYLQELMATSVLFLDDLGAGKGTEWTEEVLYRIINHRSENYLPTIITTNIVTERMYDVFGDRVTSRLIGMAKILPMMGEDRRLKLGSKEW